MVVSSAQCKCTGSDCSNPDTGVALGHSEIARTTDGGETWSKIFPPVADVMGGGSFGDSQTGYGVGDWFTDPVHNVNNGYCEKTTDGGATWKNIYTGIPVDLLCCQAFGKNILYVAGSNYTSYIGRTSDGGASWDTLHLIDKVYSLPAMSFADIGHGMVVGNDDGTGANPHGVVFSTTDSGKTWQKQYLPNAPEISGVAMLNDSIAVIAGRGNVYRTTTSGNFSSVSNQTYDFQLQIFPNPSSGIINIQYLIPSPSSVSYQIYNIQGIQVGILNLGVQNSGTQQSTFDGSALPNGAYYLIMTVGVSQETIPFTILK